MGLRVDINRMYAIPESNRCFYQILCRDAYNQLRWQGECTDVEAERYATKLGGLLSFMSDTVSKLGKHKQCSSTQSQPQFLISGEE